MFLRKKDLFGIFYGLFWFKSKSKRLCHRSYISNMCRIHIPLKSFEHARTVGGHIQGLPPMPTQKSFKSLTGAVGIDAPMLPAACDRVWDAKGTKYTCKHGKNPSNSRKKESKKTQTAQHHFLKEKHFVNPTCQVNNPSWLLGPPWTQGVGGLADWSDRILGPVFDQSGLGSGDAR